MTGNELPNDVRFRHAVPRVIREIVSEIGRGVLLEELERRKWLEISAWNFRF